MEAAHCTTVNAHSLCGSFGLTAAEGGEPDEGRKQKKGERIKEDF